MPQHLTKEMEERNRNLFYARFSMVAAFQGRFTYLLMSLHAVNPEIFGNLLCNYNPRRFLFTNMIYGIGVMLYSRPNMRTISTFQRIMFSILGSLMFNHSSMLVYSWLNNHFSNRPYLLAFLGFASGRIMMVHLLGFLYHVDRRILNNQSVMRNSEYESMYV